MGIRVGSVWGGARIGGEVAGGVRIGGVTQLFSRPVTLTLRAARFRSDVPGLVGAFNQSRGSPKIGALSPLTFTVRGASYTVDEWFSNRSGNLLNIDLNTEQEEAAFKAAGLNVDAGNGHTFVSSALVDTDRLRLTIPMPPGMLYVAGQTYTITIS